MILQLQYSPTTTQQADAAFINGTDVNNWLQQVTLLGIPPDDLMCFVVPASLQTNQPAGLFIIIPQGHQIQAHLMLAPYTKIGSKLFIPVGASLYPAVAPAEIDKLLVYDYNLLHPSIGLVGFDRNDSIQLSGLIYTPPIKDTDWSFASPGFQPLPAFTELLVEQPEMKDIIDSIKQSIETKPLEDIPGQKEPGPLDKITDAIRFAFFRGLAGLIVPKAGSVNGGSAAPGNGITGCGWLQRIGQWIEENLDELEKKRNSELSRLLQLFDENDDEALQYAIPLSDPYFNRGDAPKTSRLTKRDTILNIRNLGGGRAADGWDIGNHYVPLRTKYIKAAQQKLQEKDYRKAAYIYAHLLGDYHSAANVLEQGNFFREAATIHKDHYKNISAAAECLYRGGLYSEAIPLYKQLERHEKVGDLYMLLQQQQNAMANFKLARDIKVEHNDYIDAARIADEKMNDAATAKDILLTGWDGNTQASQCLDKYFGLVYQTEQPNLVEKVDDIYRTHTPSDKRSLFLTVLQSVNKKDSANNGRYRDIAYEIVSSEAAQGNMLMLHNLKSFVKNDLLLGSDCTRYTNNKRERSDKKSNAPLHLDGNIKWLLATAHRNQFIAIGLQNSVLYMARGNWYGNFEYYSWSNTIHTNTHLMLLCAPLYSNHVLLKSRGNLHITQKKLPKNKYFQDALIVHWPVGLQTVNGVYTINEKEELCRLNFLDGNLMLEYYSIQGDLKESIICHVDKPELLAINPATTAYLAKWNSYFYTFRSKIVIAVTEKGAANIFELDSDVRLIAVTEDYWPFHMVISTNKGLLLCIHWPGGLKLNENYFAPDLFPFSIKFIAEDKFVVNERKQVTLFSITGNKAVAVKTFNCTNNIMSVLPVSRNEIALLEQTGRITVVDIFGG